MINFINLHLYSSLVGWLGQAHGRRSVQC